MGEAKRRGTFEVRKRQSIAQNRALQMKRAAAAEKRVEELRLQLLDNKRSAQPRRKNAVVTAVTLAAIMSQALNRG